LGPFTGKAKGLSALNYAWVMGSPMTMLVLLLKEDGEYTSIGYLPVIFLLG
jgi:hypothetical protein